MENHFSHLNLGNDEQTTQIMERSTEAPDHPGGRSERPNRNLAQVQLSPLLISAMEEGVHGSWR